MSETLHWFTYIQECQGKGDVRQTYIRVIARARRMSDRLTSER